MAIDHCVPLLENERSVVARGVHTRIRFPFPAKTRVFRRRGAARRVAGPRAPLEGVEEGGRGVEEEWKRVLGVQGLEGGF